MIRNTEPPPEGRSAATPAIAALGPGALLSFLGGWSIAEGELPVVLGLALTVVGVAFLLTGAIAKGVSWGLDLRDEDGR